MSYLSDPVAFDAFADVLRRTFLRHHPEPNPNRKDLIVCLNELIVISQDRRTRGEELRLWQAFAAELGDLYDACDDGPEFDKVYRRLWKVISDYVKAER